MPNQPITVSGTTLPNIAAAGLRYTVATFGSYAIGKGWVEPDQIEGIATAIVTVATVVYGLWRTRKNKQNLIVAAEAAPNAVARVV